MPNPQAGIGDDGRIHGAGLAPAILILVRCFWPADCSGFVPRKARGVLPYMVDEILSHFRRVWAVGASDQMGENALGWDVAHVGHHLVLGRALLRTAVVGNYDASGLLPNDNLRDDRLKKK